METPLQTVVVDATLAPHRLPHGPAYWAPSDDLGAGGLVTAEPSLSGTSDLRQSLWLDEVYRLVPWYPFAGRQEEVQARIEGLLGPVHSGSHLPVVRVNPDQPWTLSLAVSMLSPVLRHPYGPDTRAVDPAAMWWEWPVPIGCRAGDTVVNGHGEALAGVSASRAVLWVMTSQAMTQEAARTDCHAFSLLMGLLDRAVQGDSERVLELLQKLILIALEPFISPMFADALPELAVSADLLPSGQADRVAAELTRPLLHRFCNDVASRNLWAILRRHLIRSAVWVRRNLPSAESLNCRADLRATLQRCDPRRATGVDPRDYIRNSFQSHGELTCDVEAVRDDIGRMIEGYFGHLQGQHIMQEPYRWRGLSSSMHLARRFGLLIDPQECWDGWRNCRSGIECDRQDTLFLARGTDGAPMAFAKRAGRGFITVVPEGFPDVIVRTLVDEAAMLWEVHEHLFISPLPVSAEERDADAAVESDDRRTSAEPCREATADGPPDHSPAVGPVEDSPRFPLEDLMVTIERDGLRLSSISNPDWTTLIDWENCDALRVEKGSLASTAGKHSRQTQLLLAIARFSSTKQGRNYKQICLRAAVFGNCGSETEAATKATFRTTLSRLFPPLAHAVSPYVVHPKDFCGDAADHERQIHERMKEDWKKRCGLVLTVREGEDHGVELAVSGDSTTSAKPSEKAK